MTQELIEKIPDHAWAILMWVAVAALAHGLARLSPDEERDGE